MPVLSHLGRRFFGSLVARRLGPVEQAEVAAWIRPREAALFWEQGRSDRRHALDCARRVAAAVAGRPDLIRAALLHDVGKRRCRLGVLGRSLASALALVRLPTRGRLAAYLAHGPAGAEHLAAAGSEAIVVAYARHHHGRRPPEVAPADWDLLLAADHGTKAGPRAHRPIP